MSASHSSIFEVMTRSVNQAAGLASTLLGLAAAEVGEGIGSVLKGLIAVIAGLFVALIGFLFLMHAAVAFLVLRGWSEAASYSMIGGGTIVLGIIVLAVGATFFKGASPVPHRTIREVRALLDQENRLV